jgi:hypothetical protein
MKKSILLTIAICVVQIMNAQVLGFSCSNGYFYQSGGGNCIFIFAAGTTTSGSSSGLLLPGTGLAIGPNFGFQAPNPTYWTVVSGIYYYYNGTSFVSTGHNAGGDNPGGSKHYLYNINANGVVSVYNGTGSATTLTALGSNISSDIIGDDDDNFYIIDQNDQKLKVYNSSAALTCTYGIVGLSGYVNGMAISGRKLNLLTSYNSYLVGTVSGSTITLAPGTGTSSSLPCQPNDFANCPSETVLTPPIEASQGGTLTCINHTLNLDSNDPANVNSYQWSGPGIIGTSSTQSIAVNSTGVYSRTTTACSGLTDVSSYTVQFNAATNTISVYQTSPVICKLDPPVTLIANGLSNYSWSPASSLSSPVGAAVIANPNATTVYTVTGSLNGCTTMATVSIKVSQIAPLVISASNHTICNGSSVLLGISGNLSYEWSPGNLAGANVNVSPSATTAYTLTATDELNCSETETVEIQVVNYPNLNATISTTEICAGSQVSINSSGAGAYICNPGGIIGSNITVSPLATTIYTVTGSNWNCSTGQTFSVQVHALPALTVVSNNNLLCEGESATLTVSGAANYNWGQSGTGNTIVISPLSTTVYNVSGTDQNGCTENFNYTQLVNKCSGITNVNKQVSVDIFPNPNNGEFTLLLDQVPEKAFIEIYNPVGQLIMKQQADQQNKINLKDAPKGLYLIKISAAGKQVFYSTTVAGN